MTITDYCKTLLADCGCSEDTYARRRVDSIAKDIREFFKGDEKGKTKWQPLAEKHGFSPLDIATEIRRIGDELRPKSIMLGTIFEGNRWGMSDLTDKQIKRFGYVLSTNKPFDTEWVSPDKLDWGFRVHRELTNGEIEIACHQEMDEGFALVDDAANDIGANVLTWWANLTDGQRDKVVHYVLSNVEGGSETEKTWNIPCDSNYEQVTKAIYECADACDEELKSTYEDVKGMLQHVYENPALMD